MWGLWYVPFKLLSIRRCSESPKRLGWWSKYRISAWSEAGVTFRIDLPATNIWAKSSHWSTLSSDLAWPTFKDAALQCSSSARSTICSSNFGSVSIDFPSSTFSKMVLILLALMTCMLMCLFVASIVRSGRSTSSDVSFATGIACRRHDVLRLNGRQHQIHSQNFSDAPKQLPRYYLSD